MQAPEPEPEPEPRSDLRQWIRHYYGEALARSEDLETNACCAVAPPAWIGPLLENVHDDVKERFYGCGYPIPQALDGAVVVDLGCGSGRDVYVLAQLVGETGFVHGLDMTAAQLEVAARTLPWHMERFGRNGARPNVAFHQGFIEELDALPLAADSVDVFVSNCVVNLSPRKDLVLAGAHRLLRRGGELYISDVVADRRLPAAVRDDPLLVAECLGGAMYRGDFEELARRSGFADPRVVEEAPIRINSPGVAGKVGAARFSSVTYRLFALDDLEPRCEDYGQVATYRGGLRGSEALFRLDDHHLFEAGRPERVCGNTAAMLSDTRFAPHFDVRGDRRVHYGAFPCGPTLAAAREQPEVTGFATGCC